MTNVSSDVTMPEASRSTILREVAAVFLKLGTIGFGGPAAHIAMMEDEIVRRRRWLTRDEFLDLLGATNLIPGPNSTEMAIHIGRVRAGNLGLVVAGVSFILPATVIVGSLAWAYVRFGSRPEIQRALYGVKPVVVAIILQALWALGRSAVKTPVLALVGLGAVAAILAGLHELLVLATAGTVMGFGSSLRRRGGGVARSAVLVFPLVFSSPRATAKAAVSVAMTAGASTFGLWPLFLVFVKIGGVLFGSGYVLLAFLRADLVERLHWLDEHQLLEAVAVGQVTPGPVFTTATFIGFILGGLPGAIVATVGIFLPAFIYVAMSGPLIPRLRRSHVAARVLDGLNVASLALMAVVTWQLGRTALVDIWSIMLAVASVVLLARYHMNSAWLVLAGAVVGLALGLID